MNVLAFAATNSRQSINKALVQYATGFLKADVNVIDLNDFEMPIYSVDREQESGIPAQAHEFYNLIKQADAVVISFAEHNGSYTSAYKNLFDWASRIDMKVYQGKPVILLATSPGPGGAQTVLGGAVTSAPYFGMEVKGSLSVASFFDKFDMAEGKVSDAELAAQIESLMANIQA